MIRKAIACAVSPPCYAAGHVVSRLMEWWEPLCFLYPLYPRFMGWSDDIEEWAGVEIMWHTVDLAPPGESDFADMDALAREWEADPEMRPRMERAREWVRSEFYPDPEADDHGRR